MRYHNEDFDKVKLELHTPPWMITDSTLFSVRFFMPKNKFQDVIFTVIDYSDGIWNGGL